MPKNLNWLEDFANSQAAKTIMSKTASTTKVAKERLIIDVAKVPGCQNGDTVSYNGVSYKIVDASFNDSKGPGVVLERVAALEDLVGDEAAAPVEDAAAPVETSVEAAPVAAPTAQAGSMGAQEYARRNPGDVYHFEIRDDVEQPSFQQAANDTMNDIKGDWNVDRTSVDGHYTNPNTAMPGAAVGQTSVAQPAAAPAAGVPVEDKALEATAAAAGEDPSVPVASNATVVGYGYAGNDPAAAVDPAAPVADMAAQDQKVGFDVGEDWVDPMGHGGGNGTPAVNVPQDVPGDDYAGATHAETPAFVQQVGQGAAPAPAATPATVDAPAARLDSAAPAPAAVPAEAPKAEEGKEEAPVADDKAEEVKPEEDKADEAEDELKGNRIAARIAKMLRK